MPIVSDKALLEIQEQIRGELLMERTGQVKPEAENEWWPTEDSRGKPIRPGDYCSQPTYPKGSVRGYLELSTRETVVSAAGGAPVSALVLVTDDGDRYSVTSKVRKLRDPDRSRKLHK